MHPTNGEQLPKQNQTTKPSEPLETNEKEGEEESSRGQQGFVVGCCCFPPHRSLVLPPSLHSKPPSGIVDYTILVDRSLLLPCWTEQVSRKETQIRHVRIGSNLLCACVSYLSTLFVQAQRRRKGEGRRENREVVNTTFLGPFVQAFMSPGEHHQW